jgi:hypothetical protein
MRANNTTETRRPQLPREVLAKLKSEIDRLAKSDRPRVLRFVESMRQSYRELQ